MYVCLPCSDMDLDDEAPPLPPRDYNYSDFEDNDDELFQSEDELDDHSWTVSDQQKLYATVRNFQNQAKFSLIVHNLCWERPISDSLFGGATIMVCLDHAVIDLARNRPFSEKRGHWMFFRIQKPVFRANFEGP